MEAALRRTGQRPPRVARGQSLRRRDGFFGLHQRGPAPRTGWRNAERRALAGHGMNIHMPVMPVMPVMPGLTEPAPELIRGHP